MTKRNFDILDLPIGTRPTNQFHKRRAGPTSPALWRLPESLRDPGCSSFALFGVSDDDCHPERSRWTSEANPPEKSKDPYALNCSRTGGPGQWRTLSVSTYVGWPILCVFGKGWAFIADGIGRFSRLESGTTMNPERRRDSNPGTGVGPYNGLANSACPLPASDHVRLADAGSC